MQHLAWQKALLVWYNTPPQDLQSRCSAHCTEHCIITGETRTSGHPWAQTCTYHLKSKPVLWQHHTKKQTNKKPQVHRDVSVRELEAVFRHGGMLFSPATFVDGWESSWCRGVSLLWVLGCCCFAIQPDSWMNLCLSPGVKQSVTV